MPNLLKNQSDVLKFLWRHNFVQHKLDPRRFFKDGRRNPELVYSKPQYSYMENKNQFYTTPVKISPNTLRPGIYKDWTQNLGLGLG